MGAFTVMGLGILGVILTLPMQNFAVFLLCFLVLFAAAGMGNGSTYRMIPTIFALRSNNGIGAQRKAAAALGLISAIGAYGGFFIPQLLGFSKTTFGSYTRRSAGSPWPTSPSSPSPPGLPADGEEDRHRI